MTTQLISKDRVLEIAETSWGKFSAEQYAACHLKFAKHLEAELLEGLGQGSLSGEKIVDLALHFSIGGLEFDEVGIELFYKAAYQAGAANARKATNA